MRISTEKFLRTRHEDRKDKRPEVRVTVSKVRASGEGSEAVEVPPLHASRRSNSDVPTKGFCIRCKITVPANPSRPYCNGCYTSWNRFKNKAYEEKYCHICGTEHTIYV